MVEIEIDGVKVEVPEGSMVMHAAQKLGKYIPHFCYHPKLSIAANCRMCLVEVEKAPKPLPACATPVSPGMVVRTASDKAVDAQKSVMEFLLINHPLDCPICDQGGECQLQDIAVGYGGVQSRYAEEKRVVFHKEIGPLVSAQEMSRCIHCTRCVRFGQEVAGTMELGMANRGEHSEILSFVGQSVDSELSGNMIDLCPVGALTSKPFRYSARTWELSRRRSIAAHDSLGSNITVQVKADKVMRVVPLENESINECWLSDRDRFSYEGLNAADRLTEPMIKKNGQWAVTDWQTALNVAVEGLKKAKRESTSSNDIVVLCSPNAPYEEMALLQALLKGLDSGIATANLRQHDAAALLNAHPWLGGSILELAAADAVIAVGLDPRNDQPLLTQRLRQSAKAGAAVVLVNAGGQDPLMPKATWLKTPASQWADTLSHAAIKTALSLPGGKFVLIGPQVLMSSHAAEIITKAQALCQAHQATLGFLGDGANWVGAYVSGLQSTTKAIPSAATLLTNSPKAVVVWGAEPQLDALQGAKVLEGLQKASFVVQACAYLGEAKQYADVLLPIAPFTETSGTFINIEGTVQSFKATVKPLADARPGWKVLRVMGNLLELSGFDFNSSEEVLRTHLPSSLPLNNDAKVLTATAHVAVERTGKEAELTLELTSFVPIYDVDAVVRRAPSLQQTKAARPGLIQISQTTAEQLGLVAGDMATLNDALGGSLKARVHISKHIADGVAYVPMGRPETLGLKASGGRVSVQVVKLVGEVSA